MALQPSYGQIEVVVGNAPCRESGEGSESFELAQGKKGHVDTRRWGLEPLLKLFHPAQSCGVSILRYQFYMASLSQCSWYYYDNPIVIYNSLSDTGSLMKQICCRWRERFSCLAQVNNLCQSWGGLGVRLSPCPSLCLAGAVGPS